MANFFLDDQRCQLWRLACYIDASKAVHWAVASVAVVTCPGSSGQPGSSSGVCLAYDWTTACEESLWEGTSRCCLLLPWSPDCLGLCRWEVHPGPLLRPLPSCQWSSAVLTRRRFMVGPADAKRRSAFASWLGWGLCCGRHGAMAWGQEENSITHHNTKPLSARFWAQHLRTYFSNGSADWNFRLCKCLVISKLSFTHRLRVDLDSSTFYSSLDAAEEQIFPPSIRVEFFQD